jgi:hypothetical protein
MTNLDMPVGETKRLSLMGYLPAAQASVTLASAARLSATFPIVTPPVDVPLPAIRDGANGYRVATGADLAAGKWKSGGLIDGQVVDAGYFDNQGADAAATFLLRDEVVAWIKARPGARVFVLEIRAQVAAPTGGETNSPGVAHVIEGPISAFLSSANRSAIVRAERTWALVASKLGAGNGETEPLQQFTFNNYRMQSVPMTWFIGTTARQALKDEIRATYNAKVLNRLAQAWQK